MSRYLTPRGEGLDVMYRNIRYAFFQPAENDMITLLHFNLHNPIMIGNKKTKDVQFYAEVRPGLWEIRRLRVCTHAYLLCFIDWQSAQPHAGGMLLLAI